MLEGEIHVSDRVAAELVEGLVAGGKGSWASPLEALSDRELEVFELIGKGMSSRTIAETLDLSVKTVDTYRARIKEKLHLEDRAELVHRAIEWIQSGSRA